VLTAMILGEPIESPLGALLICFVECIAEPENLFSAGITRYEIRAPPYSLRASTKLAATA